MIKSVLFPLFLLVVMAPSYAVTLQALNGGSGIGMMRTAELMESGEWAISISGTGAEYGATGPLADVVDAVVMPSLSYGMRDWAEVHLVTPYQHGTSRNGSSGKGLLDPMLILKFGGGREAGHSLSSAITLFSSIGAGDEAEGVVSGDPSLGAEVHISKWFDGSALHLNLGFEQSDNVMVAGGPVRTDKYTVALGFDAAVSEHATLFLQSTASSDIDTQDENMVVAVGAQFTYSDNLAMQVGYGQGFPRDRSEPESLLFASLTYAPKGTNRQRYLASESKQRLIALEQQNSQLGREVAALSSTVDVLEDDLIRRDKSLVLKLPLVTAPRTEVIDASNSPQLVEHVMERLGDAGVRVVGVRKSDNLAEQRTWIFYRKGYAREAVTLGHQIDGIQVVVKRQLPEGVDIQVLVGDELGKYGAPLSHNW